VRAFAYCFKIFWKNKKTSTAMYLICVMLIVPTSIVEILLTQILVNNIKNINTTHRIYTVLYILFFISFINNLLSSLKAINETDLQEFGLYIQERIILEKNMKLSIELLDSSDIKDLREKAKRFNFTKAFVSFMNLAANIVMVFFFVIILLIYRSYIIILISICLIGINLCINRWRSKRTEKVKQSQIYNQRQIKYLFSILTESDYVQEIKLYSSWKYLKNKMEKLYKEYNMKELKETRKTDMIGTLGQLLIAVVNVISMILLVHIISINKYQLGVYVMLTQIMSQMYTSISGILNNYSFVKVYDIQFGEQQNFLRLPEYTSNVSDKKQYINCRDAISVEFVNVSFKYPNTEKYVLKNLNIYIKEKEKIAIVGENGAGKSTFIKLLLGLYYPTEGEIIYRIGKEKVTYAEVSNYIRVVFQDFLKLLRPIRENVGLGNIEKIEDDKWIFDVLNKTHQSLKDNNLNQYIGPEFGGEDLSGGQWQKLSIARAYMREGKLLVFDEATSALDPEAESDFINRFFELSSDKTSIYITHRLTVTKMVDKIAVFAEGQIVEYGTHSELMDGRSFYYNLYKAQAILYAGK